MYLLFTSCFMLAIAEAQNYCNDQSYNPCVYQNTKVDCGQPYRQQNVQNICECIALCDNDYTCAGADYISGGYMKICMLYHGPIYAKSRGKREIRARRQAPNMCGYQPPHLGQCQGSKHYCKGCNGGQTQPPITTTTPYTTTQTIYLPPGATCPADQQIRYVLIEGVRLSDPAGVSFAANSLQQCLEACTDNRLPNGQQTICMSVDYEPGKCTLNEDTLRPEGTRTPQPFPSSSFYEKMCLVDNGDRQCPGPYLIDPQHILVGFANMVVDASSFEQCMQACVDSRQTFDFDCRSGLFFYKENIGNCILNYETRDTQPDLYQEVPLSEDGVDYFEPRCNNDRAMSPSIEGFAVSASGTSLVVTNEIGALSTNDEWGAWGACNSNTNQQFRYRRCRGNRINQCDDSDTRQCVPVIIDNPTVIASEQIDFNTKDESGTSPKCDDMKYCCPLVKSNGDNDCTQGLKFGNDFERIRCIPDPEHC